MMPAIRIHEHGSRDVLCLETLPEPTPTANEVKIKIHATSLNHMDLWVRRGIPGIAPLPLTLGCDASGVVSAIGTEVKSLQVGNRVILFPLLTCGKCSACLRGAENFCREFKIPGEHCDGTHAEFFCAPEKNFLKLADSISFETAASFPLTFLTAWHMVVANGGVKAGTDVLVMAAGSGVGSAAVQIAKHFGARVIATASSQHLVAVKNLGADFVIDHYNENISKRVKEITNKKGADLIVEHVGEKVWSECLKSLAVGGKLVTCGATTGPNVTMDLRHIFIKQQKIIGSTMGTKAELVAIHQLVADGKLQPKIAKVFSYKDVKAAHEYLETQHPFGKVVLDWT